MSFADLCWFRATSAGTGDFVPASAITGYLVPTDTEIIDGGSYSYVAQSDDESQKAYGSGTWDAGSDTLVRAASENFIGAGFAGDFTAAPKVMLTPLTPDFAEASYTQQATTYGPELIIEANWRSDDVVLPNAGWSIDGSGFLVHDGGAAFTQRLQSEGTLEENEEYLIELEFDSQSTGSAVLNFGEQSYGISGSNRIFVGVGNAATGSLLSIDPTADYDAVISRISVKKIIYGDVFRIRHADGTVAIVLRGDFEGHNWPGSLFSDSNGNFYLTPGKESNARVGIRDQRSFKTAFLDAQALTDDQTFSFPNATGTFLVENAPIGDAWYMFGTKSDGVATFELRDANDLNTQRDFDLLTDTVVPNTLYNNFLKSAGSTGVEPFSFENGTITGQLKLIFLDLQRDPADVPTLDTSNIVDNSDVEPTSITFTSPLDELFVEWQKYRNGGSGKWVIIGASAGVVTP